MSTTANEAATTPPADAPKDAKSDEPLGDAGKKALEAERTRAATAEKQLKEATASVEAMQAQLKAITDGLAALSGEPKSADPMAAVASRLDRLEATEARLKVADLARQHGITDADDIKLLESATDEASLSLLVKRLTPQSGTPKPDLTQGGSTSADALNGDPLLAALTDKLGIATV